jgi:hypothetical protein
MDSELDGFRIRRIYTGESGNPIRLVAGANYVGHADYPLGDGTGANGDGGYGWKAGVENGAFLTMLSEYEFVFVDDIGRIRKIFP